MLKELKRNRYNIIYCGLFLTKYIKNYITSICKQYKNDWDILHSFFLLNAMDWMFMSLPNSYIDILAPNVDGIRKYGLWEVTRSWGWSPNGWD